VDTDAVRQVLVEYQPAAVDELIEPLGTGLDNEAWVVGDDLVVRFGAETDAAREAALLRAVAEVSPLPVPVPVFVAPEYRCLAYRRLPGTPLADRDAPVVPALADFLHELWDHSPGFVALADEDRFPLADALLEATASYQAVADAVPAPYRPAIEAFLGDAPPPDAAELVFSHNDLGAEHVLVGDEGTVTGIVDWSDAAFTDPAYDVGLLFRDLGLAALVPFKSDLHERAVFHARWTALEDLAFGLRPGRDAYRVRTIRAIPHIFGA
jgi:aminoglycoside phosphotransferase (APT) family kinase protein